MIYLSDRGDKYEISDMEISHLVNVIGHHQTQLHTLQILRDTNMNLYFKLRDRQGMIHQVITVLAHELMLRKISITEYLPDFDENTLEHYIHPTEKKV